MPRQTALDIRLNDVISSLIPAITALKDFHGVFQTPFIQVIAETSLSLINTVTVNKYLIAIIDPVSLRLDSRM
jgi:hypothetical protein